MSLTECARCSEPIESPATLCTDCGVAVSKKDTCDVCGQRVRLSSSSEGTSSYEPVAEEELRALGTELEVKQARIESFALALRGLLDAHRHAFRNHPAAAFVAGDSQFIRAWQRANQVFIDSPIAAREAARVKALERVTEAARKYIQATYDGPLDAAINHLQEAEEALEELERVSGKGDGEDGK